MANADLVWENKKYIRYSQEYYNWLLSIMEKRNITTIRVAFSKNKYGKFTKEETEKILEALWKTPYKTLLKKGYSMKNLKDLMNEHKYTTNEFYVYDKVKTYILLENFKYVIELMLYSNEITDSDYEYLYNNVEEFIDYIDGDNIENDVKTILCRKRS